MSDKSFNFNKELLHRFVNTAQPYFFPLNVPKSGWKLLVTLLLSILFVIAISHFSLIGIAALIGIFYPTFLIEVAPNFKSFVDNLSSGYLPLISIVFIAVFILFVSINKEHLKPRRFPWLLLLLILFLLFCVTGLNVGLSYIFRFLDTSLNLRNENAFWDFLWVYGWIVLIALPIVASYRFTRLKLARYWREWLTNNFLERYFKNRAFYLLDSNTEDSDIDNPDQRISEDIRNFTSVTLDFLIDSLYAILTVFAFSAILWSISKTLTIGLILYVFLGTLIAIYTGKKMIKIHYNQLKLEADFRYSMVHVRDNSESIAFYKGEEKEVTNVVNKLFRALKNFDLWIIWQSIVDLFQFSYQNLMRFPVYILVAPLYFLEEIDFGTITQAFVAFYQVFGALSIVVSQIERISQFSASVFRLGNFDLMLNSISKNENSYNQIKYHESDKLKIVNLNLVTPNGEKQLVKDLTLDLDSDTNLMIVGESGVGKSSLLRSIAGLWTRGNGDIYKPKITDTMFLPQKPYMLLGTLRDQVCYPGSSSQFSDEDIRNAINLVSMNSIIQEHGLDDTKDWSRVLSVGEQQRLAFARIILNKPSLVILDEGTSALDTENENKVYEILNKNSITYISVGHREGLKRFHKVLLTLLPNSRYSIENI